MKPTMEDILALHAAREKAHADARDAGIALFAKEYAKASRDVWATPLHPLGAKRDALPGDPEGARVRLYLEPPFDAARVQAFAERCARRPFEDAKRAGVSVKREPIMLVEEGRRPRQTGICTVVLPPADCVFAKDFTAEADAHGLHIAAEAIYAFVEGGWRPG